MTVESTAQTPNGFTGDLFVEELLRQFLSYQFKQINRDIASPGGSFFDELFARYGDETRLQIKKWFSENMNISVTINFPRDNLQLPFVCIVSANESEAGQPYLGDYGGVMYQGERSVVALSTLKTPGFYGESLAIPDSRPRATQARQVLSIPENHTTQIYVATENVNATLYLYVTIKALLIVNKIDFDQFAGVRNLKISGSDVEHKPELFPGFAFFKVLTLNYESNFDVASSPIQTVGSIDVSLKAFLNGVTSGVIQ